MNECLDNRITKDNKINSQIESLRSKNSFLFLRIIFNITFFLNGFSFFRMIRMIRIFYFGFESVLVEIMNVEVFSFFSFDQQCLTSDISLNMFEGAWILGWVTGGNLVLYDTLSDLAVVVHVDTVHLAQAELVLGVLLVRHHDDVVLGHIPVLGLPSLILGQRLEVGGARLVRELVHDPLLVSRLLGE